VSVELIRDRVTGDIRVCGEVDASCEREFWGGLFALADPDRPATIDLRDVTFMDSTGLKALIGLARSGRSVTVIGVRDGVERLFRAARPERVVGNLRVVGSGRAAVRRESRVPPPT
jgi:anti-anti-sigma factor